MNFEFAANLPASVTSTTAFPVTDCKDDCIKNKTTNDLGEMVYENPACLRDCWIPSCLSDLMDDLETAGGVCNGSYGAKAGMTVSSTSCIVNDDKGRFQFIFNNKLMD